MKKLFFITLFTIGLTTVMQAQCVSDINYDSSPYLGDLYVIQNIDGSNYELYTDFATGTVSARNISTNHFYYGVLYVAQSGIITNHKATAIKIFGPSGDDYEFEFDIHSYNNQVFQYTICRN